MQPSESHLDPASPSSQLSCRRFSGCPFRPFALLLMAALLPLTASAKGKPTSTASANSAKGWTVQWQPSKLVNGSPVIFEVTPPARLSGLSAKWLEHDVSFSFDPATKSWFGIAGISLGNPSRHLLS